MCLIGSAVSGQPTSSALRVGQPPVQSEIQRQTDTRREAAFGGTRVAGVEDSPADPIQPDHGVVADLVSTAGTTQRAADTGRR